MSKDIEIQVDSHPSGRLTLKEKASGTQGWEDAHAEGLIGNPNHEDFYRRVARRLAEYAAADTKVVKYSDSQASTAVDTVSACQSRRRGPRAA